MTVDVRVFKRVEHIPADFLKQHPMPEEDDLEFGFTPQQDEPEEEVPEQEIPVVSAPTSDPFASSQFSAKTIQGSYDSHFGDLSDDEDEDA